MMGDSSGCSAATGTGRAKWIILHTKLDEDEKGFRMVVVGKEAKHFWGHRMKTPPRHPHLWLPFQSFIRFFRPLFFFIEILPPSRLHFELPTHAEECCKMSSVSEALASFCGPPPNVRMRGTCGSYCSCSSNIASCCHTSNITNSSSSI